MLWVQPYKEKKKSRKKENSSKVKFAVKEMEGLTFGLRMVVEQ